MCQTDFTWRKNREPRRPSLPIRTLQSVTVALRLRRSKEIPKLLFRNFLILGLEQAQQRYKIRFTNWTYIKKTVCNRDCLVTSQRIQWAPQTYSLHIFQGRKIKRSKSHQLTVNNKILVKLRISLSESVEIWGYDRTIWLFEIIRLL